MFVKEAFIAERFMIEAVFIDILLKDASKDSCKFLKTYKFVMKLCLFSHFE